MIRLIGIQNNIWSLKIIELNSFKHLLPQNVEEMFLRTLIRQVDKMITLLNILLVSTTESISHTRKHSIKIAIFHFNFWLQMKKYMN